MQVLVFLVFSSMAWVQPRHNWELYISECGELKYIANTVLASYMNLDLETIFEKEGK